MICVKHINLPFSGVRSCFSQAEIYNFAFAGFPQPSARPELHGLRHGEVRRRSSEEILRAFRSDVTGIETGFLGGDRSRRWWHIGVRQAAPRIRIF